MSQTVTKAKDTPPTPGRRATEKPNMEYPKRQVEAEARTKRAIRKKKHARRMSGGAPSSPNQVLKNQRDTPGRATTGQDPRNPRNYASSVRAQENGRTRHFRTRTLRTENHPEKVETDKHRPGAREITMSRGRDVARSNARTAMPETRNHDHTLGREVRHRI